MLFLRLPSFAKKSGIVLLTGGWSAIYSNRKARWSCMPSTGGALMHLTSRLSEGTVKYKVSHNLRARHGKKINNSHTKISHGKEYNISQTFATITFQQSRELLLFP